MSNNRFFSEEYVQEFLQKGKLPKIHDSVGYLLDNFLKEGEVCLDMGACTGLMGIRAIRAGAKQVIALEAKASFIDRAIKHPAIIYYHLPICMENAEKIADILMQYRVSAVIARRVIPEIAQYDSVGMIYELAKMFYNLGVEKIFLEGRVEVAKPRSHFSSVEKEIEAFASYYRAKSSFNNAYLLVKI